VATVDKEPSALAFCLVTLGFLDRMFSVLLQLFFVLIFTGDRTWLPGVQTGAILSASCWLLSSLPLSPSPSLSRPLPSFFTLCFSFFPSFPPSLSFSLTWSYYVAQATLKLVYLGDPPIPL
jgi:hypothetical protein